MRVCLWMLHPGSSVFPSPYFLSTTRIIVFATCFCHHEILSHHAHRINRAKICALKSLKTWALIIFLLFQVFYTMTKILINVCSLINFCYKLDNYYTDLRTHVHASVWKLESNWDCWLSLGFGATDLICWDIWWFFACTYSWPISMEKAYDHRQSESMFGNKGDYLKSLL